MKLRMPSPRTFAGSVTLLAAAWIALWACAPTASLPPPLPMVGDQEHAIAGTLAGGVYLNQRQVWEPDGTTDDTAQNWVLVDEVVAIDQPLATGQILFHRFNDRVDLGASVAGGYPIGLGGGMFVRHLALQRPRLTLGYQVDLGFLYASVSMPLAYALNDRLWLSTAPRIQASYDHMLRLPVGLSWDARDNIQLYGELGVAGNLGALQSLGYIDGMSTYGAFGVARRW